LIVEKGLAKDHADSLPGKAKERRVNELKAKLTLSHADVYHYPVETKCSILLYQVTSNTTPATHRQSTPLTRLLAFVLLAFVTYSATAEAVHKHGNLSLAPSNSSAQAVLSPGDASSTINNSRATGECVICQLRQQLSVTLLSALPQIVAPLNLATRTLAALLPCSARYTTPRRGRAPPPTSLI
jgi:hypothetical protein